MIKLMFRRTKAEVVRDMGIAIIILSFSGLCNGVIDIVRGVIVGLIMIAIGGLINKSTSD